MMMCDPMPAMGDNGGQLVLQGAELESIIPVTSAGVIGLGRDQVAACHQLVALDGSVVVDGPAVLAEGFGEVQGQPILNRIRRNLEVERIFGSMSNLV